MKQHFILINYLIILIVLLLQPLKGCKSNNYHKTIYTCEVSSQTKILINNAQDNPALVWFSKDSSVIQYFFGARPGGISIMHTVFDKPFNLNVINAPIFINPYVDFVKVLDPGDSLVVIIKDSTFINDIHVSDVSSLSFIDEDNLNVIKAWGYMGPVVTLDEH